MVNNVHRYQQWYAAQYHVGEVYAKPADDDGATRGHLDIPGHEAFEVTAFRCIAIQRLSPEENVLFKPEFLLRPHVLEA